MLRVWKVASGNLKIGKPSVTLAVAKLQEIFMMKFNRSQINLKQELFVEGIYYHKTAEKIYSL